MIAKVKFLQNWSGALLAALMLSLTAVSTASAQNVLVFVNGEPITALDVEQRTKFHQLTAAQKNVNRTTVLNELVDEKLKIKEGKRWGIDPTPEDIDASYANMATRMRQTPDQLTQNLSKQGIGAGTFKARLRAEMVWGQLVRGRYSARLQLSEKDIEQAMAARASDDADTTSIDYIMRPILFLVTPGSPPTVFENRRKEAEAFRGRFKSCEDGVPAARAQPSVVVRDQVIRSSGDLPVELRKLLDAVPVGQLTAPETTKLGIEMFAMCGRQESKADTPGKRKAREVLASQRFDQQSKQYLQRLRRDAMIERK